MHISRFAAAALLVLLSTAAGAQTLQVAAASDLQTALPVVAGGFEQERRCEVVVTFGSSGTFFAQIQNGAPFDVFLSADIDYPRQLERAGHAEPGSLYPYATGRLVLWTRRDSGIDLRGGLAVLASPGVRRVAIANPDHAPYGRAAVAALRHEGLYERVQAKLVRGENVSQAAQFVQSGNADVGVLALSRALAPTLASVGAYVEIPESFHPPIEQAAIVVAASRQKALARQFIEFLKRTESREALQAHGLVPARAPL